MLELNYATGGLHAANTSWGTAVQEKRHRLSPMDGGETKLIFRIRNFLVPLSEIIALKNNMGTRVTIKMEHLPPNKVF